MARSYFRGAAAARFVAIACGMVLTGGLTGCGGGDTTPIATAQPVATDTQATSTSAASRAYSPNYGGQIVTHGVWYGRTFRFYCPTDADAEIVFAALDQWNNATDDFFSYERTATASGAQVVFSRVPQSEFAPGAIGTTHYTYDRNNGEMTTAQVQIAATGTLEDQVRVAKHEFGHVFGIHGHSATENDMMSATVTPASVLTERDVNTLFWLYRDTPAVATSSGRVRTSHDTIRTETVTCSAP